MESLGAQLKAAREEKHLTLAKVATDTRISAAHLDNLEAGRYQALPGGVYNRAFLRAYCEYLGLDAQAMLDRYRDETSPPLEKPTKTKPKVRPAEPRFRMHPIAIWSLMLVFSIAGLYVAQLHLLPSPQLPGGLGPSHPQRVLEGTGPLCGSPAGEGRLD